MAEESWQAEQTELDLYIENEAELYPMKKAIVEAMKKKIERGQYDAELAIKGWLHWVDAGAVRYCKEFKVPLIRTFPIHVRRAVAKEVAEHEYEAIKAGEYGKLEMRGKRAAKKVVKNASRKSAGKHSRS